MYFKHKILPITNKLAQIFQSQIGDLGRAWSRGWRKEA